MKPVLIKSDYLSMCVSKLRFMLWPFMFDDVIPSGVMMPLGCVSAGINCSFRVSHLPVYKDALCTHSTSVKSLYGHVKDPESVPDNHEAGVRHIK